MDTKTSFTTTVQEYEGTEDYYIEIPDKICKELNWKEGDTIDWKIDDQGIIISKIKDTDMPRQETRNPNIIIKEEIEAYLQGEFNDFD
jgi:bifunctional DNA-binding transcriptional regulator/antitoxin component of YhaV-PrlF toxin-antitoxin module